MILRILRHVSYIDRDNGLMYLGRMIPTKSIVIEDELSSMQSVHVCLNLIQLMLILFYLS